MDTTAVTVVQQKDRKWTKQILQIDLKLKTSDWTDLAAPRLPVGEV